MSEQQPNNGLDYLYEYDVDLEARLVYFIGEVDEKTVAKTIKSLYHIDHLNKDSENPRIGLYINSDGGSVEDSFALYDCIQGLDSRIYTIGTGMVCSAALLILACGTERYATENCWCMAHQALSGVSGNEAVVMANAKQFIQFEQQRYRLLARHTKWTAEEWRAREKEKGEVWMPPREMLRSGLVDKVLPGKSTPVPKRKKK